MKPLSVTPWNTEGNFSHDSKECPFDFSSPRKVLNVPTVDGEAQKDSRPKKEKRKSAVRNQRRIGPLRGRLGNFQIVTSTGSIKRALTRLGNEKARAVLEGKIAADTTSVETVPAALSPWTTNPPTAKPTRMEVGRMTLF